VNDPSMCENNGSLLLDLLMLSFAYIYEISKFLLSCRVVTTINYSYNIKNDNDKATKLPRRIHHRDE
jgi:hypothetical protein